LILLDLLLAGEPQLQDFAAPSRRVGQSQLQKLRPLRDQRMVQRYLQAVDGGQANAWHTLVYGLTLAVYSLPLRQGLLGYAHQTTRASSTQQPARSRCPSTSAGGFLKTCATTCLRPVEILIRRAPGA